jgi:hypothetical protein
MGGPQHQAKPAASLEACPLRVGTEGAEPLKHGEGHGRGEEPGNAAVGNPPAYGAWTV